MKPVWLLLLAVGLTTGCGVRQPPLPQAAATGANAGATLDQALAVKLRAVDAVYFCLTKSSAADDAPAWQIAAAMTQDGTRLALGWATVPAEQQALFDQWQAQKISSTKILEELVRPETDSFLRHGLRPEFLQVALGASRSLLAKIRNGESLSVTEEAQLPQGFQAPPESLESFVERASSSPRLRRYNLRRLYRMHLVAEQTIAQSIVNFHNTNASTKLLIFLPNDLLIDPHEVAAFVAQKMPLRQLILDREQPMSETRGQLIAAAKSGF